MLNPNITRCQDVTKAFDDTLSGWQFLFHIQKVLKPILWSFVRVARSVWRRGYGLDDRGSICDTSGEGIFFLFAVSSRPALGPTSLLPSGYRRGGSFSECKTVGAWS